MSLDITIGISSFCMIAVTWLHTTSSYQAALVFSHILSNNVLDATKEFSILVSDPLDVAGLPVSLLQLTAANAATKEDGTSDGWVRRVTVLDAGPFLLMAVAVLHS